MNHEKILYPLIFEPILKSIIWGGDEICKFKNITPFKNGIGECWEVSGLEQEVSIVKNGFLKGKSLNEVITNYGGNLIGELNFKTYKNRFPLLLKLIDAQTSLSVQVHPNDILAKKRHNSFGKTEMWYIIKATEEAFLYAGFRTKITPSQYIQSLKNSTLINYLNKYKVKSGDVFFLPAGCIHAIGAGCFIAEIQQTSDITYRVYDYNRKDAKGCFRPLHVELSKDAIEYKIYHSFLTNGIQTTKSILPLIKCSYFSVNQIKANKNDQITRQHTDIFVIYMCLQGTVTLTDNFHSKLTIKLGETVLVPASTSSNIRLLFEENSILLEVYT